MTTETVPFPPPGFDWDAAEKVDTRYTNCVRCRTPVAYEVREFGPRLARPPYILCDKCYLRPKVRT